MEETYKREYSGPYQSLAAIWNVLRVYSSEEHPLSVQEIYDHLTRTEESPPSPQRLKRLLDRESGAIQTLYPTLELQGKKPPSYSTVDNHLKRILTDGSDTTYQLQCVAHKRRWNGEVNAIPYEDIEANSTDEDGRKNNVPRRYYLKGPLSQGEWRFLSDFVRDCPYLSRTQIQRMLFALDLLVQPAPACAGLQLPRKPAHPALLAVAEQVERAIRARKKLLVTVGRYALLRRGGRLVPVLQSDRNAVLEPYGLAWKDGRYWLIAREEEPALLRLDRLLRAELQEETFTPPADLDPAEYRASRPAAPGERAMVRLRCSLDLLGDVADLLGQEGQYSESGADGRFEVTAFILPERVKPLALCRPDGAEVLEPESLRRELLQIFRRGVERYGP